MMIISLCGLCALCVSVVNVVVRSFKTELNR
jgi:hypothetical protein